MHPRIFFREKEYKKMLDEHQVQIIKIKEQIEDHFKETRTVDDLNFRVSTLDNSISQSIVSSFSHKVRDGSLIKGGLEERRGGYNPAEVYGFHTTSPNNIFYFSIFILILSLLLWRKKFLRKFLTVILIFLLSFNLYNYFIFEANLVKEAENDYDPVEIKRILTYDKAMKLYDSLYPLEYKFERKVLYYENKYQYEYDVYGEDEYGNSVKGRVEVDNEDGGNGFIYSQENIEIEVKWVGHGELEGEDDNGNIYYLKTE